MYSQHSAVFPFEIIFYMLLLHDYREIFVFSVIW